MSIARRSSVYLGYAAASMRFGVFQAVIVLIFAGRAEAQGTPPAAATPPTGASSPHADRVLTDGSPSAEQAAEHFERALAWYRAGKYRRAVDELGAALVRDPGGKDLVFNLALVQEKLGDLSGAIASLERFQTMEKDPKELERASQTIERLQGARAELIAGRPAFAPAPEDAPPCPEQHLRGKFDGWVIGTGTFALASLVVGSVFAVRALTLDAAKEPSRGRDAAIVADVALSASLLAGAGSLALYFGRFADAPSPAVALPVALPRISSARVEFRY